MPVLRRNQSSSLRAVVLAGMLWLIAAICCAQTFEVAPVGGDPKPTRATSGKTAEKTSSKTAGTIKTQAAPSLGWGSGLEVAQQARAAQAALAAGDYAAASSHAERAAKAAPQNADLWFLFGYAARLAGRYQISADAFQRGLAVRPASIQGMAGLAQTYAKMGRTEDAQRLLLQVIAAQPNNASDLQLAGELSLGSDPEHALELLKRADALDAD